MTTPRIILQFAGGELTLFTYRRAVGMQQVSEKLMSIAHTMFSSWEWGSDIQAIESGDCILMAVIGSNGKEVSL